MCFAVLRRCSLSIKKMAELNITGHEKGDLGDKICYFYFKNVTSRISNVYGLFWPLFNVLLDVKVSEKRVKLKSWFGAILDWIVLHHFAAKYPSWNISYVVFYIKKIASIKLMKCILSSKFIIFIHFTCLNLSET